MGILKLFISFVSFSLLGGSSLAVYSGLLVEIFYPPIFAEFWGGWWVTWVAIASLVFFIRSHLKNRILVQDRDGADFQTGVILLYVEDLKRGTNKDIGPKDIFEMASRNKGADALMKSIPIAEPDEKKCNQR